MSTRLFGYQYNYATPGHTRDVNVAWASGSLISGQGNYGLVVVPATASGLVNGSFPLHITDSSPSVLQSGKKTITWFGKIYGSSLRCTELQVSSPSAFRVVGSGSRGNVGCLYQANLVYEIPINNVNNIWISTSATSQDINWTAFG